MAESTNSIAPGQVIDGKYVIGRVIGSGGMGTVYEAVRKDLDRRVALKILHSKYSKSNKIIKRFHQEARFAGSIEHDNICRVIDHGTAADGAPYLVMPLLTGSPLRKLIDAGRRLPQMQIVDIACQTLQALAAAHERKVVHRDLKPDNIFVTRVGDREDFVKLLDFGISKVLENDAASDLTATGMVLGTAYYLAPEQARGAKRIDHRVDVYAMGVILYEALTGTRPFEGDTYNEVVFKIAGEPVKPPRSLNAAISPAIERIILKAMAIDPNARFSTATEMCAALERAMVDTEGAHLTETLTDTEVDGSRPVTRGIPVSKRLVVILPILGIAFAAVLLFYFLQHQTPESKRDLSGERDGPQLQGRRRTEPGHASEPDPEKKAAPITKAGPTTRPRAISADAPEGNAGTEEMETSSDEKARAEHEPPNKSKKAPIRSGSARAPGNKDGEKSSDRQVINGRFNTKFVFIE